MSSEGAPEVRCDLRLSGVGVSVPDIVTGLASWCYQLNWQLLEKKKKKKNDEKTRRVKLSRRVKTELSDKPPRAPTPKAKASQSGNRSSPILSNLDQPRKRC